MPTVVPVPSPYRFTREEYYRMGEAGIFDGKRVELLEGEIISMSPQSSPHASAVQRATYALIRLLGGSFEVRAQLPIVLDDLSEPEPDVAICAPDPSDYARGHPKARDVLLLLEIGSSSLAYDRGRKAAAYARAGIRAYGLVDLDRRVVELMTEPDNIGARYARLEVLSEADRLPLPGGAEVAVTELLPLL